MRDIKAPTYEELAYRNEQLKIQLSKINIKIAKIEKELENRAKVYHKHLVKLKRENDWLKRKLGLK